MRRSAVCVLVVCLCCAAPRGVQAQNLVALAKKHYLQGEGHYRQGEFAKALEQYRKALSYKRYPALLFNIAQCHRQLDQHKKAIFFYKLFLVEDPNTPNKQQVLQMIRKVEQELSAAERLRLQAERNKGQLSIVTQPPGAQVLLDKLSGKGQAVSPTVLRVKAGQHLVVLSLKGYRTEHRTVTVPSQGVALVKVTLESLTKPRRVEARPPPRKVRRRPPVARRLTRPAPRDSGTLVVRWKMKTIRTSPFFKRWWFWTGLIIGGGAIATGAYFGMRALQDRDSWEKTWDSKYKGDGQRNAAVADVMFVTGGSILLGVIIGMAVVRMGTTYEKPVRVELAPRCGPQGCGLWVKGSF
ncbi:MAG: tetratricopeptide repeat protein [bacterium]